LRTTVTVMLKYLFQYKYTILLAAIIALLSLLPSSSLPDSSLFSIGSIDKIVHFCMYSFFGFVGLLETRCYHRCLGLHFLLLTSIFGLSVLLEVLQATLVPSRSAEWFDLVANLSGLTVGYIAYRIFRHLRSFRS
jgi:VanZ family protein